MSTPFRVEFEAFFDSLRSDLIESISDMSHFPSLPANVIDRMDKSLAMNARGGKYARGMTVIDTATTILTKPLTQDTVKDLFMLGWVIEIQSAAILVIDDIMDNSTVRRGKPCWYRRPEVGLAATNDACLLHSITFWILNKYFRTHPGYVDMVDLMHRSNLITEIGQTYDNIHTPPGLQGFTREGYNALITYKTGWFGFTLPVVLTLHYLGRGNPVNVMQSERLVVALGNYLQVQDDFLDVFGDPAVLGKVGTDIQENKLTWMITEALELCTVQQRQELETHYGVRDVESERKVKDMFKEIGLEKRYAEYQENVIDNINRMISDVDESEGLSKAIFERILSKCVKRNKWEV
ncbi:terpenoid synthase [Aspergillus avenaceus]|uniref:Terpenoid synthase n=1 Tax=Aspergillus avenaceus TaxID=36643 RepID=A0A5N6TYY7_ASPAV|nr:terpenoid synthase [Aspergillus avenaceus]